MPTMTANWWICSQCKQPVQITGAKMPETTLTTTSNQGTSSYVWVSPKIQDALEAK